MSARTTNADAAAWEALQRRSRPIPLDPSRGHRLYLAKWPAVNGGVVMYQCQAFCTCYWSQPRPTYDRSIAVHLHAQHVSLYEPDA